MKVWVCELSGYDESEVVCVFDTKDKADSWKTNMEELLEEKQKMDEKSSDDMKGWDEYSKWCEEHSINPSYYWAEYKEMELQ